MLRRIEPPEEAISGLENARQYAETVKKSPKIIYRGFLKEVKSLNITGEYLEIGAGPGILTAIVAEDNPDVHITAVELSPDMVAIAQECIEEKGLQDRIRFVVGNANDEKIISEIGKFDLVYCTYTLHHWEDPERVISNLLKAVKDRGILFIHDLKRVWWLYYLPLRHSGFINSIRAAYIPSEIVTILDKVGINQYDIKRHFPFFLQSIIVKK
jgi:2-polyprenyl-3-methyl-5-hydroxy-6-metoxy-1,4-benzoquinol methylase